MSALLRGELIKAVTTRTMLGYALTAIALSVIAVLVITQTEDLVTVDQKQAALAGGPIVLLLFGIVGAAGEYRHRTAAPAALIAPGRGRLLTARAAAYAVAAFGVAAAMVGVTLALGLPLLAAEPGAGLGIGDVATVAGGSLAAAAIGTVMGVAVGTLLRNQVVGVVGALILAFIVEPLVGSIIPAAVGYMPVGAASTLAGQGDAATLAPGSALLALLAWTLPLMLAAIVAERRRDLA